MVTAAEDVIDYPFIDKELLWEGLQAAGSNMAFRYPEGNKRLAMIGDAVLKLVVLEDLRAADLQRGK
jgi:dsRNA-specific ribonuclease